MKFYLVCTSVTGNVVVFFVTFFKATEEKHFYSLNKYLVVLLSPKWLDFTFV